MRMIVVGLCAALFAVTPAMAQEMVIPGIWGHGILGQQTLSNTAAANRPGNSGGDRKPAQRNPADLPFERYDDLSDQIEQAVSVDIKKLLSVRFQMKDAAFFVRTAGTRPLYRRDLKARSYPEDSLAGATALFLAVGWELANGQKLTTAQNAAILQQARDNLKKSPLAGQGKAALQQEAETRLIIAGVWLEEARLRADGASQQRALSDSVWNDMKTISNNDMRAHAVTTKGLSKR